MRLHLSESSHLFADYTNEAGKVLYRAQTNSRLWPRMTKISKRISDTVPRRPLSGSDWVSHGMAMVYDPTDVEKGKSGTRKSEELERVHMMSGVDMQDRFAHLARVDFQMLGSSKIVMGGQEFNVSSFFRKGGLGWYGRDRVFTGPDGKEYKWILGLTTPKLILNDGSKTVVAEFHKKVFSFTHKPENVYLEVMLNGEHMVDLILVTFVYIEKLRKERERSTHSSGGGGPGGGDGGGGGGD